MAIGNSIWISQIVARKLRFSLLIHGYLKIIILVPNVIFNDTVSSYLKNHPAEKSEWNKNKPLTSSCCCCHSAGCFFCTKYCATTCKMNPTQLMIAKARKVLAPPMDWNRTPPTRLPKERPVQWKRSAFTCKRTISRITHRFPQKRHRRGLAP